MVKKEFDLSEKEWTSPLSEQPLFHLEDVKRCIKEIKEDLFSWIGDNQEDLAVVNAIINIHAGDKLF